MTEGLPKVDRYRLQVSDRSGLVRSHFDVSASQSSSLAAS